MKGKLLIVLLLFCFQLSAQNPLGFSLSNGKSYVELSFREESNLIVIPIVLNGRGPFNFILDTGSESGLIFDKLVISENNLISGKQIPIYADNGNKITDILIANDLNIEMSGVKASQQSMLVLEEDFLNVRNILGVDAHGILGSELFSRFVVEIDYKNEKIRLYEHNKFKAPRGFKRFDIEVRKLRPYLKTTIKQAGQKPIDLDLLIDSGASSALFLDEQRHENIVLPKRTLDHVLGSSLAGSLEGKLGRVKKVKLGKFKFKNVLTSYPEDWRIQKDISDSQGSLTRHGTLGSDILSRFTIIYDYLNKDIYLKKNASYREDFKFNRAGFSFIAGGSNLKQYFVSDIIPGSPAEKIDLQEGDEIIAMAGKPVFFYSFSEVNGFLRKSAGTKFKLIIRRDGELHEKEIRLKKLI